MKMNKYGLNLVYVSMFYELGTAGCREQNPRCIASCTTNL